MEQFSVFVSALPQIEATLAEEDIKIPRPVYESKKPEQIQEAMEEEEEKQQGSDSGEFEEE